MNPMLKGALVAGLTIAVVLLLARDHVYEVFAILLALAAGVYVGFGYADGRTGQIRIQWAGALPFAAIALLGLWVSPWILAAGWVTHALWDLLHHHRTVKTKVPAIYPPLCLGYDAVVAAFIVYWWTSAG